MMPGSQAQLAELLTPVLLARGSVSAGSHTLNVQNKKPKFFPLFLSGWDGKFILTQEGSPGRDVKVTSPETRVQKYFLHFPGFSRQRSAGK